MGEDDCEQIEYTKKGRHRKKQLYSSILQQMEFYFSDSNLSKDRFLSQLISQNSYVDIKVFLKCNKIRKLNCTIADIQKAISKSELIELSEDKEKICRKKPIVVKENVDDCTIYVENIKTDANHEWLGQVFSEFGKVVYVSIPKYKQNKGNKGFAFVEFDTEKEAQSALNYFESIGCKMPSVTNPEDLQSIKTFENDVDKEHENKNDENLNCEGKKIEMRPSKKRKITQEEERQVKKPKNELNTTAKIENQNVVLDQEDVDGKKRKKHKKDKRKNYIKELGLRILSKREWKKMRNRYLDLQKKKMKEFKRYLHQQKFSQTNYNNKVKPLKDNHVHDTDEVEKSNTPETKLEFTAGVIVKLKLQESCQDTKKLKNEIKAVSPDIKYIDIPLPVGSEEVFIRFSSNESAKNFCQQELLGEKTILENEEEAAYWERIQNNKHIKFNKNMKKQRGRDKLLKKAEKERAKHIRFDEGD